MRVVIAAMGSRGDIQPALALALGLRSAGHLVTVSAPPDFAGWAAELNLPFVSAGESIEKFLNANIGAMNANPLRLVPVLGRVLAEQTPIWFDRTLQAAEGADVIVSCHQFASRSVAEKLRIPCFCVVYQPTALPSAFHPPLIVPWQGLPRWANRILWTVTDAIVGNAFLKPFNQGRQNWRLSPMSSLHSYLFDGVPYFLAADTMLVQRPPDWSRFEVIQTGPWFYEDPEPLTADVEEFLQAGPPPIYVGFGSMPAKDPARLTKIVVEGTSAAGPRVLMSKGWAGIGEGSLPPNVKVVHQSMPHHRLFPRLAAVVHHGGAGTMATALRAGVPQILVPHLMDQFYYAYRMAALKLAPPGIPAGKLSAERLTRAIKAALVLSPEPRREAALRLQKQNGVTLAIQTIEARMNHQGLRVT